MDINDLLDELNILLGDTDNFTFTPEEKTRALTEAINDKFVVTRSSETASYDNTVRAYAVATVDVVRDVQFNTTDDWPRTLPSEAWTFENGNVYIDFDYRYTIPHGATLTFLGNVKVTVDDTINSTALQEYILVLAHLNTLKLLGAKKTNRFIKNDTNMNEIIALRRDLQLDVVMKRQALQRSYQRS